MQKNCRNNSKKYTKRIFLYFNGFKNNVQYEYKEVCGRRISVFQQHRSIPTEVQ